MLKGPIIECEKCNKQYKIEPEEFEEEEYSSEDEEPMGFEINHTLQYERSCKFCDNPITVEIEYAEYPVGAINDVNYNLKGCKIIKEAEIG